VLSVGEEANGGGASTRPPQQRPTERQHSGCVLQRAHHLSTTRTNGINIIFHFKNLRESARAEKFKTSPPTTLRSEAYREEDPLRPSKHEFARIKDWFAANSLPWTFGCVKTRWKEGRLTERVAFRVTNNCAHVLTASNDETCR